MRYRQTPTHGRWWFASCSSASTTAGCKPEMKRGLKPIYRPAIVRLLSIGPLTVAEIALRLPCCLTTAYDNVRALRKAGVVRVHSYEKSGNMTTALMTLGSEPDAQKPQSFTALERMRKMRHKMSADDKDFLNARRRQRNRKIKIDPLIAAFFGGMR